MAMEREKKKDLTMEIGALNLKCQSTSVFMFQDSFIQHRKRKQNLTYKTFVVRVVYKTTRLCFMKPHNNIFVNADISLKYSQY